MSVAVDDAVATASEVSSVVSVAVDDAVGSTQKAVEGAVEAFEPPRWARALLKLAARGRRPWPSLHPRGRRAILLMRAELGEVEEVADPVSWVTRWWPKATHSDPQQPIGHETRAHGSRLTAHGSQLTAHDPLSTNHTVCCAGQGSDRRRNCTDGASEVGGGGSTQHIRPRVQAVAGAGDVRADAAVRALRATD